jgi:hypothetical protein
MALAFAHPAFSIVFVQDSGGAVGYQSEASLYQAKDCPQ